MSLVERITDSIDACRKDLARVAEDIKWAMEPGLTRGAVTAAPASKSSTTVTLDLERCVHCHEQLSPDGADGWITYPGESPYCPAGPGAEHELDPDFVRGPRFALEVGDPRMRTAFLTSVQHLALAEIRTTFAVAGMNLDVTQPKPVRPDYGTSFHLIDLCRAGIAERLTIIERDLELVEPDAMKTVGHHLHGARRPDKPSARKALDLAVRALEKALMRGVDEEGTAVKKCWVCKIRPEAEKTGKRCNTCATWKHRNPNRGERPTDLDSAVVDDAKRAQARRWARGEGWGIA